MGLLNALGELFTTAAKEAEQEQENPAQPTGWAVDESGASTVEPVEDEKRRDQVAREDKETLENPDTDPDKNPAQPAGWATASNKHVLARVFQKTDAVVGSKVLLRDKASGSYIAGLVEASDDDLGVIAVRWSDDVLTCEPKNEYELVKPQETR